jgi:chorismate synthase
MLLMVVKYHTMVEIEVLRNIDSAREITDVIKSAWGSVSLDQDIKDIFLAANFNGGISLVAREHGKIKGINFGFPGYRSGKLYLYSHLTGIANDVKGSGIGYALKIAQKNWAVENGYDLITWTFDPLMRVNASLNIGKIGAISRNYHFNFYGKLDDSLNFGLNTDRILSEWWLNIPKLPVPVPHVIYNVAKVPDHFVLDYNEKNIGVEIPADFLNLKKLDMESAGQIQKTTGKIISSLFTNGYIICGFLKKNNMYVLTRNNSMKSNYGPNVFSQT